MSNKDQQFIDQVDKAIAGTLAEDEMLLLQALIDTNPDLSKMSEEHRVFIGQLKQYGQRKKLKNQIAQLHLPEASLVDQAEESQPKIRKLFSKYYGLAGLAAGVALVSISLTILGMQYQQSTEADYRELVRKVDQIGKTQKQLADELERTKGKLVPAPGKFAGTGFLIAANGYVLTSEHVVKGADSVVVENESLDRLKTTVVYTDQANDVAVLRINDADFKSWKNLPYIINTTEANLGESTFTLGFPREDIVYGEGSVSAGSGYHQNPNAYQISVPVNPGNSGGPLLNSKGDLIGMISGYQTEKTGTAFAIKSTVILQVLTNMPTDSLHAAPSQQRINKLRALSRVDQVKQWRDLVFTVRVYK